MVYLRWTGPGFYIVDKDDLYCDKIATRNLAEAEGVANLAGLDPKRIAYFEMEPSQSLHLTIIKQDSE